MQTIRTMRPKSSDAAGKRLDALVGITFHPESGFLKRQQFFVYGDVPVVQSLDGRQPQRSWVMRFAWQREF